MLKFNVTENMYIFSLLAAINVKYFVWVTNCLEPKKNC